MGDDWAADDRAPLFDDEGSAREFVRAAGGRWVGARLRYFDEVDSANSRARRLADLGWPVGTAVLAEHQTEGRGKLRRRWFCPPCAGLLVSVLVPAAAPGGPDVAWLTAAGALAMAAAVEAACGIGLRVDWPNDLVVADPTGPSGHRKVGGVLVETRQGAEAAVLGVGLNVDVRADEFQADLRLTAGSLRSVFGRRFDRLEILGRFLPELERRIDDPDGLGNELRTMSFTLGREVAVEAVPAPRRGTAVGFDERMRLLVEFPDGAREAVTALAAGDVA